MDICFSGSTPVEVRVENDTIDLEMRIFEGKQATINRVSIKGNTRTNDHVVIRELRTKPGQLLTAPTSYVPHAILHNSGISTRKNQPGSHSQSRGRNR
jgi:hypothetical protein